MSKIDGLKVEYFIGDFDFLSLPKLVSQKLSRKQICFIVITTITDYYIILNCRDLVKTILNDTFYFGLGQS